MIKSESTQTPELSITQMQGTAMHLLL